jgi:hypothetical protein
MSGSDSVVRQLLAASLLDELHLRVDPIVVRKGRRPIRRGAPAVAAGLLRGFQHPAFCTSRSAVEWQDGVKVDLDRTSAKQVRHDARNSASRQAHRSPQWLEIVNKPARAASRPAHEHR